MTWYQHWGNSIFQTTKMNYFRQSMLWDICVHKHTETQLKQNIN